MSDAYPGYKLSGSENKRLTIRRMDVDTEGRYRCRGVNGFGSQVERRKSYKSYKTFFSGVYLYHHFEWEERHYS